MDNNKVPVLVSFGSGKGGVGRSVLTVNSGIYLAQLGYKVILIDGDIWGNNLHTLLGIKPPLLGLSDFLTKDVDSISDIIIETSIPNLYLIGGNSTNLKLFTSQLIEVRDSFLSQILTLKTDFILLDLSCDFSYITLDLFSRSPIKILIVTPDYASVERAYRFLIANFIHSIRTYTKEFGKVEPVIKQILEKVGSNILTPLMLERELGFEEGVEELLGLVKELRINSSYYLILNKVKVKPEIELGTAIAHVLRRVVGIPAYYLGYVEYDEAVSLSLARKKPVIIDNPGVKFCKNLEHILRRLLNKIKTGENRVPFFELNNYYDILEVYPGSGVEEIRAAYRWLKQVYSSDSLATYSIMEPELRRKILREIEEAYNTLVDPHKRRLYDLKIFPNGIPNVKKELEEDIDVINPHRMPENLFNITQDTEFSGELLKKIRVAQGIELKDISERTKISITYLKAIEEEDFDLFPALVYVRGFLKAIAHYLKLDPQQVVTTYLKRYRKYLQEKK